MSNLEVVHEEGRQELGKCNHNFKDACRAQDGIRAEGADAAVSETAQQKEQRSADRTGAALDAERRVLGRCQRSLAGSFSGAKDKEEMQCVVKLERLP